MSQTKIVPSLPLHGTREALHAPIVAVLWFTEIAGQQFEWCWQCETIGECVLDPRCYLEGKPEGMLDFRGRWICLSCWEYLKTEMLD
ncbi:MAG: hypothetical protein HY648_09365 [Acidobacteria bacterium]|nr:hypothetical protein [Acidobacteriota bacterium]